MEMEINTAYLLEPDRSHTCVVRLLLGGELEGGSTRDNIHS